MIINKNNFLKVLGKLEGKKFHKNIDEPYITLPYGVYCKYAKEICNKLPTRDVNKLNEMYFTDELFKQKINNLITDYYSYTYFNNISYKDLENILKEDTEFLLAFSLIYVNSPKVAIKSLQKLLNFLGRNITVDGLWGNETKNALENAVLEEYISEYLLFAAQSYLEIPQKFYFYRGWVNRCVIIMEELL